MVSGFTDFGMPNKPSHYRPFYPMMYSGVSGSGNAIQNFFPPGSVGPGTVFKLLDSAVQGIRNPVIEFPLLTVGLHLADIIKPLFHGDAAPIVSHDALIFASGSIAFEFINGKCLREPDGRRIADGIKVTM